MYIYILRIILIGNWFGEEKDINNYLIAFNLSNDEF